MRKNINVGIIGYGQIGTGLVAALLDKKFELKKKIGVAINISAVCDKDLVKLEQAKLKNIYICKNADELIENKDIDVIVELIGGIHPAEEIILKALKNKKHVITANKALLSQSLEKICQTANENNVNIYFEASVGGGIPIIKSLREGLVANKIEEISAIINGTCNFILSEMSSKGTDFKEALKIAQAEGYAEADPSLDIDGWDSAHKIVILSSLAYSIGVKMKDVYVEGIKNISSMDIKYCREFGYVVKLLAIAKVNKDKLRLSVHPTLLPKDYLLSQVNGSFNAIYIKGDLVGETIFYGRGAGPNPTSSAIISDLVNLVVDLKKDVNFEKIEFNPLESKLKLQSFQDVNCRYYLRIMALDSPGVLSRISGILGSHKISIASVMQKERAKERAVPIVMLTHNAEEKNMEAAVKEIYKLSIIKQKPVLIRIQT
ncbi:MAG: homoserine dehydrogenase [Candidatus Omnitrophota bacterium]